MGLDSGRAMKRLFDPAAAPVAVPCRQVPVLLSAGRKVWECSSSRRKELEESSIGKRRKVAAAAVVVTVNLGNLDCLAPSSASMPCTLPSSSSISVPQRTVGHAVCSSCHEKLPDKCHRCVIPSLKSLLHGGRCRGIHQS